MQEFEVAFHSFADVQDFVFLATDQPFEVYVSNGSRIVDAKSFMVMFSLDYSRPLKVSAKCTAEQFRLFREAAARFSVA